MDTIWIFVMYIFIKNIENIATRLSMHKAHLYQYLSINGILVSPDTDEQFWKF